MKSLKTNNIFTKERSKKKKKRNISRKTLSWVQTSIFQTRYKQWRTITQNKEVMIGRMANYQGDLASIVIKITNFRILELVDGTFPCVLSTDRHTWTNCGKCRIHMGWTILKWCLIAEGDSKAHLHR